MEKKRRPADAQRSGPPAGVLCLVLTSADSGDWEQESLQGVAGIHHQVKDVWVRRVLQPLGRGPSALEAVLIPVGGEVEIFRREDVHFRPAISLDEDELRDELALTVGEVVIGEEGVVERALV